ncbi:hypothetical protein EB796_019738 [Bugula neritina]|uniref:Caspase family p20 domain-containing protein n=1 Tax=Bugula neritina TaxID=10212 RepID=A0A7J7J720_BUGNE|nr:hypothetical protein EB796_019738 [Bugula neritina]
MNPPWVHYHGERKKSPLLPSEAKHFSCKKDPSAPECLLNPCEYLIITVTLSVAVPSLSEEQNKDLTKFLTRYKRSNSCEAIFLDKTEVESDADSDLSDHEDFFLPEEEQQIKMEVSATRKEEIKRLFYSNQVYRMSETARGRVLIINNNVFSGYPQLERTSSIVDVKNTLVMLRDLDFVVNVKYNRTAEVTETSCYIETETQRPDHEDYGMHILYSCLMVPPMELTECYTELI